MMTLTRQKKEPRGGVIEFPDLEPGTYTAEAEAWNTDENILEGKGSGSTEITVKAGETTDCNITMILEGQTAYYSKYTALANFNTNIECDIALYDYSNLNTVIDSFTGKFVSFAEDKNSNLYYILYSTSNGYRCIKKTQPSLTEVADSSTSSYSYYRDLYYEPTTDTLYRIGDDDSQVGVFELSCIENVSEQSDLNFSSLGHIKVNNSNAGSVKCFAVKDDKVYMVYNYYNYATTKYDISVVSIDDFSNSRTIGHSGKSFNLSGGVTDMAVLEDGTVAVLVNDKNLNVANQFVLTDGGTINSRGALVVLSSDLSDYKVYGWSGERTISAKLNSGSDQYNGAPSDSQIASIAAYIPEYEERDTHFYGPLKIVAVRPKELVIADCGANFVLPDYSEKKNGKMFTHNRLMTVDLRNFAINCKKEFSTDEIKFWNLAISGNLESVTAGWTNLSAGDEK